MEFKQPFLGFLQMFIRISKVFALSLIFVLPIINPVLADTPNARKTVESLLNTIKMIITGSSLSAEQKEINKKSSRVALRTLNVSSIGRKTLGKYWRKRTPEEQRNFLAILSQLFTRIAFPKSGRFFADLNITYGASEEKKGRAIVPITVIHKNEGEVDIDFILDKVDKNWLVVEVILDGVSMRNNLRSQFYKIIKKNNYQELIRRMTRKLKKPN